MAKRLIPLSAFEEPMPSKEYGLFSDEGLIESGFASVQEAIEANAERYPEDELTVAEICPYHSEQSRDGCEECNSEEEK